MQSKCVCLRCFFLAAALVDAGRVHALQHKVRTARGFCQFALQLTQDGPSACRHTIEEWALC